MNKNELIKSYILRLFSQELQYDETPTGAMERKQLTRWLLNWANEEGNSELKNELVKQ
jgi:hypothetical protein